MARSVLLFWLYSEEHLGLRSRHEHETSDQNFSFRLLTFRRAKHLTGDHPTLGEQKYWHIWLQIKILTNCGILNLIRLYSVYFAAAIMSYIISHVLDRKQILSFSTNWPFEVFFE